MRNSKYIIFFNSLLFLIQIQLVQSQADNTAPEIFSSKLKVDNSVVSITFTESVYNSSNGSGNLEASDFNLTINGGNATLSSSNPSSISIDGSTISLGIPINGIPDGDEILTISPANNAIFDAAGNPASTSQTSNTIQLISDIVTSGLMIYLDASNENSYSGSGSNWYDLTSNGNDGVISGTTFSNDGGGSFEFGSSSDYVEIGDDPSLDMDNNQMTISYLVEIDRTGTGWSPAIEKGSGLNNCGTGNLNYYTWYGNTDLQIDFVGNTNLRGQLYHATTDDFYTGQFRLITITIDQSNVVKTYIDGEIKHTLNHNGQVLGPVTDGPLVIGKCPDPDGKIRSLMIYNRALSSDEVYQNYNSLSKAPKIISTSISADNSTVSVTFDKLVYNSNSGSGNLETTDFSLSISGGTSTLSSSTPSSISISGDTIELGVPLLSSYDGNEQLTVNLTSYSVFNSIGYNASSQQVSNTVSLNNLAPTDIGFQSINIPTDGLVLHLDAQNSNSNTGSDDRWSDLSSSGNDILFSNPKPLFTQDSNGVKILRTTNATGSLRNMVSAPTNPNVVIGNNAYTAISFFKPNSTDSRKMILSYGPPDNNCNGAQLHPLAINNKGKFGGGSCGGRNTWDTNSGVTPSTSQYVFQATSWDGSTERVYINGTLDKSSSSHTNNVTDSNNNKFSIGWVRDDGASYTMDADIGVILFYNRKLSDSEINDIYQNYNDRFTNGQIPSSSNASVQEGSSVGTLVTNLVATDPDSTEFTFSLISGDGSNDIHNSYFTVSGTQLIVNTTDIDFETTSILNINLQVSDGHNTLAKAFTVSVTNINEAPTDLSFEPTGVNIEYLVVGGGGGGGGGDVGAGGGAGGFRTNKTGSQSGGGCAAEAPMAITAGTYTVVVGAGGNGGNDSYGWASDGGDSSFNGIISKGGGGAPGWRASDGRAGGSGSGSTGQGGNNPGSGESCQGYNGGTGLGGGNYPQGGGGGAGGLGENAPSQDQAGAGGPGLPNPFEDSNIGQLTGGQRYLAGGGGGGVESNATVGNGGVGGGGIGGRQTPNLDPGNGLPNTGGGGGGEDNQTGGSGGSGVVILRYLGNPIATGGTVTQSGGYTMHTFTQVGNSYLTVSSGGTSTSTASFDEGSAVETMVAKLTATDPDSTDFTFSLISGDGSNDIHNSYFTVSGTQLLVNNADIDFETTPSLNIYVQASDGVNIFAKALTVSVTNINEAPTDIGISSNTISESVSASSTIATLSAVDSDTSDTHIFTLIEGDGSNDADNSSFTISGTSLIINSTADYETKSSYTLYINVNDGVNDFAKAFTVSVTNIDEVPVDIELESSQNVIQNNLILHLDAENTQSYPGNGGIWYDLTSNNHDFNLNGATYDENGFINFDGENDWARTISTLDLSAYDHVTIQINALIENNSEVEITFEHSENWNTNDGGFGLANHCGGSTYINNLHHTNHMGFPRNYEADLVNEFQLQTNIFSTISDPTGRLTYIDENLINFSNQPTGSYPNGTSTSNDLNFGNYHFYIGSRGGTNHYLNGKVKSLLIYGSKFSADDVKMNFEALNTNENISVKEISSVGSLVANLVATDPDSSNFTFSLVQGDGSNDVHNSYFTVSGTQLLVNNPNIDFESTPSLNINLQVSDGANTFAKAFTVSVTNINEAPIDLGFTTSSLLENGLVLYLDSRNPNSYSGSGNTWSDLSGNSNDFIMVGNFSHSASNGFDFETGQSTKYFKDDSFAHPTTTFTDEFLIKTSRNTNSAWKSYNVSGNDNQSMMMQFSNEDNLYLGLPGGDFYSNVSGISDGAWHHLVRTSNRTSGAEKIYLDGQLVYNQTVQAGSLITTNGHYYIGQEQDSAGGGLDASQAFDGFLPIVRLYNRVLTAEEVSSNFSAMISNGNPTPVNSSGSSSSTASFDEGSAVGTVVATLTATDSDTTNLTYSLVTGNGTSDQHNSLFTVSGNQLLVASSTISYDTITSLNVNIEVSDGQHTITKAFQIAVNDLNRAPTDIVLTSNTITENASPSTVVGTLSSVDSDTTDTTSFTLATSGDAQDDDNGSFTISGTSLILNSSPDYETKASYNIYINVNDGANNYAKAFTVSVTNINEAPTNIGITSTTINSDAFKFNGTNSYIEIPYAAVNHPAEFTIELWARLDQSTNNFQSPLSSRYGSSPWNNLSGYNFYAVNGLEKWSFTGGSGSWESINTSPTTNEEIYDGNTLKFGIWTHLASTYDGTTYRLYVNGILVGSKTAGYSRVGFNSIPARPLRIGAGRTEGSATYFFNGAVDEVRIWNYARTQSQIDYNKSFNLSGQESGLVSYYQFESGTATNKTGVNGTNGTLYNSPTTVSGIVLFPTSGSNSGTVDEESSIGTLVGYLIANDPDTADLTYSLVSGDGSNDQHNSLFSISGNQLLVAGNIDYETNSTLNIYVQVSDGENTYEKAMIVNVNDIKEVTSIQVNDIIKTFGDADFDLSATSSNTGAFTYTVTDQNIATVNGSTVTIVGAGSTSITVVQAEDDNFASSTATFTLTVNKTDPTITLSDISKTYGDDDFNLSASSSSTGAFTYSVTDQNIAMLNGNILTVVGAGSTSITVSQAADNNYNTSSKTINLSVAKGTPVLSFNDVVKNYGDTSFTIEAQSQTSSGSLTFSSSDNSVVSISGSTATVNGAGSSIITVTQSETANYTATTTSFTITVNKIDPTLSEFSNVTKTFGDPSFEITPPIKNNDNTGVFTYSSSDPSIASINNNNLTINGAGSVVLTANLGSDNNYNSGSISTNVTVEKANQTISIGALPENQPLKDFNSIPLSASSSSNAPIAASLAQGSAASLSGGVGSYSLVSIQQTGIVTITFTTDDSNNPNYKTVSTTLSINVVKSNQSVSYSNNPPSQITYSENLSITLGASASSGLAPEYAIVSGDNASLNNNILSINDTGQITVEASQPGDVNYNPAVPITSIINVIQAPTTLSSLSVPNKTMQDDDFYLTPVVSNRTGDIIYTSSDPQVAIVSGTLVRIIGVGDATITATQNANSKYLSAQISANFTITIGDSDGDGIVDVSDNCDFVVNPEQLDTDGDGIGDLCDPDLDGDGVTNELDNCPMDYNPDQANNDNDSRGDICDSDDDNDSYSDIQDFFPFDPNEWLDTDRDGIGNNADTDDDNDKYLDTDDAFPLNPREWIDTDGDGIGNNKDKDDDNDGVEDKKDAFPLDESEHTDTDKDGIGNNSDQDDDGDGYLDDHEIECNSDPLSRYKKPRDYDDDMIPDCIDTDDDNDGCPDEEDILPLNEKECLDTDGDGIPDGLDFDADNDGVLNFNDDFPLDPNESKDTDGDGIGDNQDEDANNDGYPEDPIINENGEQVIPLFVSELLTPNQPGEESVWKIINIEKYPSMNVKVYNPNGIIMFESWNYQNDWTGTDKEGKPLPTGPYFYRIDRANETTVEEGWMYIFN